MEAKIVTFSGLVFDLRNPSVANVRVEDIAHALANQCRFSGHARFRYSLAEHSVRLSELLEAWGYSEQVQTWGLLRNASEAYLFGREHLALEHPALENKVMVAICRRFSLPEKEPPAVRAAGRVLLATEARDLMPAASEFWKTLALPERIRPWGGYVAEFEFVERYRALTGDAR